MKTLNPIANYTIQEWLFNTAHGKYEIDLAESGVQFQNMGDINFSNSWEMDYSLDKGNTRLRDTIKNMYGSQINLDQCMVTHGAQEALYLFYRNFLNAGDHVITTTPGWQQSWEVPKHIGCNASLLLWSPGEDFNFVQLEALINVNTKLLIINSPCNPTGTILSPIEWKRIIEIAHAHDLWIVNDEEYLLDFSDSVVHKYEKSLSVSSLSKIYGLPALRVGWAVSNAQLIKQMINYKRYTTVCNSLICEYAANDVLVNRNDHIDRYQKIINQGKPILLEFSKLAGRHLSLIAPQNTPFAWFNFNSEEASKDFVEKLLKEQKVLVMCAEVFGATKGIRLTYARSPDILKEGLNRILLSLGVNDRL